MAKVLRLKLVGGTEWLIRADEIATLESPAVFMSTGGCKVNGTSVESSFNGVLESLELTEWQVTDLIE